MKLYNVIITDDLGVCESVLLALLWYKQDKVISQKVLARSLKCSDRTIRNYLKELETKQYIKSACLGKKGEFLVFKKWFLSKTHALYDYDKERRGKRKEAKEKADALTRLFKMAVYGSDKEERNKT